MSQDRQPRLGAVVDELSPMVPFPGPAAMERQSGIRIKLRIGSNESAFGISAKAQAAIEQQSHELPRYADPQCHELRIAIARRHGVRIDNVLVASGIDELLGLLCRICIDPCAAVGTTRGTYPTFVYHARGFGARVEYVDYSNDQVDLDALGDRARATEARIVYVANPDNPSGSWQDGRDLLQFSTGLPADSLLILDEAYWEFAPEEALPAIDVSNPSIVHCRTFSKAHGLAGLRVGYLLAHQKLIATIDKIRLHFGVNRMAQVAALTSLEDTDFVASVVAKTKLGREDYCHLAASLGLQSLPSATNFVSIDLGNRERAASLRDRLFELGVFVYHPVAPPLNRCLRVSVGTAAERERFAEIFSDLVDRKHGAVCR